MTTPTNPFVSLTRTVLPYTRYVLDAIDADGRAWWLIAGDLDAPEDWTELLPLPGDESVSAAYALEPPADGQLTDALVDDLFNRFADSCDEYGLWSMGKDGLRAAIAALAEPEPAKPTDDELDLLVIAIQALAPHQPDATTHDLASVDRGREILSAALARWGRR